MKNAPLRIGEIAHVKLERVIAEYKAHRDRGWGMIAQNLGIKPGSDAFHALKSNRLRGKSKGKGKGPA